MEYCGGGRVTALINAADGHLDEELIAYICCEMLAGLAYLHSIGKVAYRTPAVPPVDPVPSLACDKHQRC